MNKITLLCVIAIAANGCCDNTKFNTKVSSMAEIQKMDNVVEISIWDCERREKLGECPEMRKWSGTSDEKKISEIMAFVRELKIVPGTGNGAPGFMICFKDKKGNFQCVNYEYDSGKIIYGLDYRDETGKFFDVLISAGLWDIEPTIGGKKAKIAPMTEIQKMDNVKKISMWYYQEIRSSTEIKGLEKAAVTTDKKKIADIMSVLKELKIAHITDTAPLDLLCFEDPNGKLLCTYFGPDTGKETSGVDYEDKTGKLYDAIKSAGFPLPEPIEPKHRK